MDCLSIYKKCLLQLYDRLICSAIDDDLPFDSVPHIPLDGSLTSDAKTEIDSELVSAPKIARSVSSLPDTGTNKKPRLTANAMLMQELDWQRQEKNQQKQEYGRQIEQQRTDANQREDQLREQFTRERGGKKTTAPTTRKLAQGAKKREAETHEYTCCHPGGAGAGEARFS